MLLQAEQLHKMTSISTKMVEIDPENQKDEKEIRRNLDQVLHNYPFRLSFHHFVV